MMKQKAIILLIGLLIGPGWATFSVADEQRYISIRNTDSSWIQGTCSLVFKLDNGGSGEFKNLTIKLQLTDNAGKVLSEGTLDVPPFGDSNATRSIDTATEFSCDAVEQARSITLVSVTEQRDAHTRVNLPISTFDPQYYQPLKISLGK